MVKIRRVQKSSVNGLRRGCSQALPPRAAPNTSGKLGTGDILQGSKGEGALWVARVQFRAVFSRQCRARDGSILSSRAPGQAPTQDLTHPQLLGAPGAAFSPKLSLKTEDGLSPGESAGRAEPRVCKQRLPRRCTALGQALCFSRGENTAWKSTAPCWHRR